MFNRSDQIGMKSVSRILFSLLTDLELLNLLAIPSLRLNATVTRLYDDFRVGLAIKYTSAMPAMVRATWRI